MIWKSSTKAGCGISGQYVVCHYCPAGNIRGNKYFDANVLKIGPKEELIYLKNSSIRS